MNRYRGILAVAAVIDGAILLGGCSDSPIGPGSGPESVYLEIFAGADRSCALRQDGDLVCWGRPLPGAASAGPALVPVPVAGLLVGQRIRQVALGGDHSCALAADGRVACWGSNRYGEGGRAEASPSSAPQPVTDPARYTALGAGLWHTCALSDDDQVWCWGHGARGAIGAHDLADSYLPVRVGRAQRSYTAFDIGGHHGCALDADSQVRCWGWNRFGQLGVGVFVDLGSPERITRPGPYAAVFAGAHHSCALEPDGQAWCWGRGEAGQLGHGVAETTPDPVPVAGDHRFLKLAPGRDHTCGLREDGAVFCWGHNRYGRLGTGGLEAAVLEPVPVDTEHRFRHLSAGHRHTCALTAEGHAYCWGHGGFGQLGTGLTVDMLRPYPVARPQR